MAAAGPARSWEGPELPKWANIADQSSGVGGAHLLVALAVALGVALLGTAWALLLSSAARGIHDGLDRLWWTAAAWAAPLLLAAPFATQDVWLYGAQGRMVTTSFGGYADPYLLGHSVWLLGVDPKWAARPSLYGPGALDLSAFFVRVSGNHPWISAECWRLAAMAGLALCAWGVWRIASLRGSKSARADATTATVLGVANPAMLVLLVGGIHNDALMLGLVVAGMALAANQRQYLGSTLCALAVGIKPAALLAVGALAWWAWGSAWKRRTIGVVFATGAVTGALFVTGLVAGGGFGWLKALKSYGTLPGPYSIGMRFLGAGSGPIVNGIEALGIALGVTLVIRARPEEWVARTGWGLAIVAITTTKPEPWYVAWAIVLLACDVSGKRLDLIGILTFAAMMIGSVVAFGVVWWFAGVVLLAWLALVSLLSRGGLQPR